MQCSVECTLCCAWSLSHFQLFATRGLQSTRLPCPWDSSGKNTGVGCHALLQGIFPTLGLNPDLPPCRWILYRWRRKWQPTPVLLPGKSHGWRSLVGYRPWGHKELDMTKRFHFFTVWATRNTLWGTQDCFYGHFIFPLGSISLQ